MHSNLRCIKPGLGVARAFSYSRSEFPLRNGLEQELKLEDASKAMNCSNMRRDAALLDAYMHAHGYLATGLLKGINPHYPAIEIRAWTKARGTQLRSVPLHHPLSW